jgi:glycosyltransferase involved in cell wall biosynthesis
MRVALLIQKFLKKPIVLLVEDAGRILSGEVCNSRKIRSALFFFRIPSGPKFWSWLCEKANAMITCSPRDQAILGLLSKNNESVFFLPWPSFVPDGIEYASIRENSQGVYIGSLSPNKNTQEFEQTLPLLLEKTSTKKFTIVGPGSHATLIRKLKERYGEAISYVNQLPRTQALKLISSSYYAYTPVRTGGWGFIGDCWSMKTPIVLTHNDNYVTNNVNALVASDENDLVVKINRLFEDTQLYQKLQKNGFEEYEKRKADAVGDKLYDIFTKVLC